MIIGARSAEVPCQVRPRGTPPWHWSALAGTENAVARTFHASGLRLRPERADGGDVEVFLAPLREPARARALSPADKLDRPDGEPLVGRELRAASLGEAGHPCRDQPAP